MRRAQIQLEDTMYDELRRRAFQERKSISRLIREIIRKETSAPRPREHSSIKDFRFVASGRSKQGTLEPVSERHDEAIEEAFRR